MACATVAWAVMSGRWSSSEEWEVKEGNLLELRERAQKWLPSVCRSCEAVREWPAMSSRRWSAEYLAGRCEERLLSVRAREEGEFVFQRAPEALPFPDETQHAIEADPDVASFRVAASSPRIQMSPERFFNIASSAAASSFLSSSSMALHYWAGDSESFSAMVKEDVETGEGKGLWVSEEGRSSPLWIGQENVTVRRHFDYTHNVFVQLCGRKTLCLSKHGSPFATYPYFHPGYRQEHLSSASDMTASSCVTLQPGDVLYLPPFVWHWTRADTFSVSLSFFSNPIRAADDQLLRLPLPFEPRWSSLQQRVALSRYLASFPDIISHMQSSRYLPTFGPVACDSNQRVCPFLPLDISDQQLAHDFARTGSALLGALDEHNIADPTVRRTLLASYFDKLLIIFLPDPNQANYFIQCCISI
ncbi:MAG: cupin-like domain-containing protein [archaeon]|nr:cupin-like domain-containing protein [archaeon]